MDPNQPPVGRARGRGRGLFQHPTPFHSKDGHPGPQREPWSLPSGPPRPPAPQPGRQIVGVKHSSSEDSQTKGRGGSKMPATSIGSDPSKRVNYPDIRPDNIRGTLRPNRPIPEAYLYTRPKEITSKVGTSGQKITCEANYFRLTKKPEWNIHLYHIEFSPDVPDIRFRRYLVGTQREMLGGYLFDGTQIFLVRTLDGDPVVRTARGTTDETVYTMTFTLAKIVSMNENQSMQVLNLILRRAMDGLHLETVGRNKYDPAGAVNVQSLRLEIWPGYITSIRQHEEDILVCTEISHKIMRNETVLQILSRIKTENRDFKNAAETALLGMTVLTRYNNKTYRIDEISFDVTPKSTFKIRDNDVSYVEYYKTKYQLDIRDENQPMLISNLKEKDRRGGMTDILLVPELCYATGLTDEMKSNFRTMREMAQYTKVPPAGRIERLLAFNQRLRQSNDSARHLADWSLGLDPDLVKIPARILPYPQILFGNEKKAETNSRADWQGEFRNNSMAHCIDLKRWYLITPSRARREAEDFVKALQRAGSGMRFNIGNPRIEELPNDIQTAVSEKISQVAGQNPQMIMCVVSNNQGDRYATIKKRCYLDFGVPSQVMVAKTITPKDKTKGIGGLMSVATKVAIQMNAKLGGLPWLIAMPVSGLMTVGYDVCHDPKNKSLSWGAMVATMDLRKRNNEFFSAVNRHKSGEEVSKYLGMNMVKAVNQFQQINGVLPEKIMFFRDGVGDGQIRFVLDNELAAIKEQLKDVYAHHGLGEVLLLYMIVTKRVNTRIFFDRRNPDPGTCVDDIITLPERYDFYLVSQSVREGTVSPTGFNIIHDTMGLPPDRVQALTFRFTYFYYNWSGTVRVPALCQYAHKLAFIASQSMQSSPTGDAGSRIERTLYFL